LPINKTATLTKSIQETKISEITLSEHFPVAQAAKSHAIILLLALKSLKTAPKLAKFLEISLAAMRHAYLCRMTKKFQSQIRCELCSPVFSLKMSVGT
jgi:hypothetical protein